MGKCVNIFTTKPYFTHEKYPNLFDTALISPGGLLSYKILIVIGLHLDYVWTSGFQFMGLSRLYLWPGTVFAWNIHGINIKNCGQNRGRQQQLLPHQLRNEGIARLPRGDVPTSVP